jgi:antitoxin component YwqK of YwqJK toxin-antitoxin module
MSQLTFICEKKELFDLISTHFENVTEQALESIYHLESIPVDYTGIWFEFDKRDQLILIGEFENGMKKGKWTTWYNNGKKKSEGFYSNDQKYGMWICWQKNSVTISNGSFWNVTEVGEWIYHHPNGQYESFGYHDVLGRKLKSKN